MAMAETAEAAPKRSLKPLLISGVLALVLGGGGYYAASHGLIPGLGSGEPATEEGPDLPPMAFVVVPPLIVSLGEADEQRHLRFVSQLEVTPDKQEQVQTLLPRIAVEGGVLAGAPVVVRPIEGEGGRTIGLAWRHRSPRAAEFRALGPALAQAMRAPDGAPPRRRAAASRARREGTGSRKA